MWVLVFVIPGRASVEMNRGDLGMEEQYTKEGGREADRGRDTDRKIGMQRETKKRDRCIRTQTYTDRV